MKVDAQPNLNPKEKENIIEICEKLAHIEAVTIRSDKI